MSLSGFQSALALLIRLPEHNRGADLPSFLEAFALSEEDRSRLRLLAADPKVVKYGRNMRSIRWGIIENQIRSCLPYLPPDTWQELHASGFAPQEAPLRAPDLAPAFLDFLLSDPEARSRLAEGPRFLPDLLKSERARMRFRRDIVLSTSPAPAGSCLRHGAFLTLRLDHDVPAFLDSSSPSKDPAAAPQPRAVRLLLLAGDEAPDYRCFEIDDNVESFLGSQFTSRPAPPESLESYGDLVGLGLAQPISHPRSAP